MPNSTCWSYHAACHHSCACMAVTPCSMSPVVTHHSCICMAATPCNMSPQLWLHAPAEATPYCATPHMQFTVCPTSLACRRREACLCEVTAIGVNVLQQTAADAAVCGGEELGTRLRPSKHQSAVQHADQPYSYKRVLVLGCNCRLTVNRKDT